MTAIFGSTVFSHTEIQSFRIPRNSITRTQAGLIFICPNAWQIGPTQAWASLAHVQPLFNNWPMGLQYEALCCALGKVSTLSGIEFIYLYSSIKVFMGWVGPKPGLL